MTVRDSSIPHQFILLYSGIGESPAAAGLTLRMAVPINTAPRADSIPVGSDFALVILE
jgi:hypothetical protein